MFHMYICLTIQLVGVENLTKPNKAYVESESCEVVLFISYSYHWSNSNNKP